MNRIDLFPISATIEKDTLSIAGHDLAALAKEHGTPLYLYDRATIDAAAAGYKSALASHYPGPASVLMQGKHSSARPSRNGPSLMACSLIAQEKVRSALLRQAVCRVSIFWCME